VLLEVVSRCEEQVCKAECQVDAQDEAEARRIFVRDSRTRL
jgi:hypothetical protein